MHKKIIIAIALIGIILLDARLALCDNQKKRKAELYRQIELFSDTLAIIDKEYADETSPKDLIYGSLKGMLSSLDPHSQFMDPEAYRELKEETEGKFGGLGVVITIKDGLLTIITPLEDTPAWKAGLKSGDRIVKINNELTREMLLSDAVKKMRGKPGEIVNLTVLRDSEKKLLDFKITRAIIKIKDIKHARILEDGIGYIRLVEFRENTPQEFNIALSNLSRQRMNALIIDLRNNPGGLLEAAVKVTGKFIPPNKMIVYTKGRQSDQNLEFYSENKNAILDLPLVILINQGSASGSEIVAGALQDYKRAIIIGTKSFGKGSVQSVIPLRDGSALRLTTSRYFIPSGKIINGKGVSPDIEVEAENITGDKTEEVKSTTSDRIFDGIEGKAVKNKPVEDDFNYKDDPAIARALDTLKGIKFYKESRQEKLHEK